MVERRGANMKKKKTKRLNKEERKVQDHQGTQVHTETKTTNVGRPQGKHEQIEYSNPWSQGAC
jgi:hypothetical protein